LVGTAAPPRRRTHWGGGYEHQHPPRSEIEEAAAAIRERLGFGGEVEDPVPEEQVELRPPRLKRPRAFRDLFSDDRHERLTHAQGKAYRDVVRGFRGEFPNPPDLVALPRDESEVEVVLSWCEEQGAAAIPFGGGTSVVGGIEPRLGERPSVSVDLRRLDRVLDVDALCLSARIQAGAAGPALEDQLREHGLTLRHFPQSFEYSTLGGWVATRAGGHFATLYTHIDDLVESVRAITPRGTWESRRMPGSGAGPSPDRLLLGSEGIRGGLTEASVRVRPRPAQKLACGVLSDTFETAITWDRFEVFQSEVMETVRAKVAEVSGAPADGKGSPRVSCRFTHVYPDGPAPYFTVLAPAVRGGEVEQWDEIKAAASEAVIEGGGTITHHHAVGRDHRPWYDRQRPAPFAAALRGAKAAIDPAALLNPGVLIDP
jgi:FAD/FMN-containing dehydrogenase